MLQAIDSFEAVIEFRNRFLIEHRFLIGTFELLSKPLLLQETLIQCDLGKIYLWICLNRFMLLSDSSFAINIIAFIVETNPAMKLLSL